MTNRPLELPCACANLRRAARAVTQLYEDQIATIGTAGDAIHPSSGSEQNGPYITQGGLGELLSLDSTTLRRTLKPLVRRGWVRSSPGRDRRERHFQLAAAGRRELD
jgi:hypothetical protein